MTNLNTKIGAGSTYAQTEVNNPTELVTATVLFTNKNSNANYFLVVHVSDTTLLNHLGVITLPIVQGFVEHNNMHSSEVLETITTKANEGNNGRLYILFFNTERKLYTDVSVEPTIKTTEEIALEQEIRRLDTKTIVEDFTRLERMSIAQFYHFRRAINTTAYGQPLYNGDSINKVDLYIETDGRSWRVNKRAFKRPYMPEAVTDVIEVISMHGDIYTSEEIIKRAGFTSETHQLISFLIEEDKDPYFGEIDIDEVRYLIYLMKK